MSLDMTPCQQPSYVESCFSAFDRPLERVDPMFTPAEVALWLRVSMSALAKMRKRQSGPAFVTLGSGVIRYRNSDLQAWVSARMGRTLPLKSRPERARNLILNA